MLQPGPFGGIWIRAGGEEFKHTPWHVLWLTMKQCIDFFRARGRAVADGGGMPGAIYVVASQVPTHACMCMHTCGHAHVRCMRGYMHTHVGAIDADASQETLQSPHDMTGQDTT